jgi:glycosyltransferase involved in cell wall biosynthesis
MWGFVDRRYAQPFIEYTEAALRTADFVITPSQYARAALLAGYSFAEDRVVAVHHGVDTAVFRPGAEGGRSRVAAALSEDVPYVLFVSVAAPQKNLPALIEAMDHLRARGYPHALAIAGATAPLSRSDPLRTLLDDVPAMSSRTAWLGHVDDPALAGLMAEADAFCLPSFFESFGLGALEAMACGAPVVVSNRGALPEVVDNAGVTAEPTIGGLKAALELVLSDAHVATRLRSAGPARAREMTWERTAEGWLNVLRRAAESRPARRD